ncbi:MAG: hypothetical protein KTV68_02870 [Acidimicrobiia bacterium]|nr:hypothetical protein [Acidimicrobiia bacterium]MCY4433133.1 hypothetical protein [bacterium]
MAWIDPKGLLKVAEDLVRPIKGQPLQARLRRSISTAYYSLFTALTNVISDPYQGEAKNMAKRLVEHGAARSVCKELLDQRKVPWLSGTPACDPSLLDFAEQFVDLQKSRMIADYDHNYKPAKRDALDAISAARQGLINLESARKTSKDQLQAVCVAMIAKDRKRLRQ